DGLKRGRGTEHWISPRSGCIIWTVRRRGLASERQTRARAERESRFRVSPTLVWPSPISKSARFLQNRPDFSGAEAQLASIGGGCICCRRYSVGGTPKRERKARLKGPIEPQPRSRAIVST